MTSGCAPTPGSGAGGPKVAPVRGSDRKSPAKAGDVASGAGTLESVRRQLEGKWDMASLEVVDASGKPTTVAGTGKMSYDGFGNFDLDIAIDPAAANALGTNAALSVKGRAVIDVAKGSMRVQDVEGAPAQAPNVNRERYYAFEGDILTLSTRDAAGKVTSSSKWKRQP